MHTAALALLLAVQDPALPAHPSKFTATQEERLWTGGYSNPSVVRTADGKWTMVANRIAKKDGGVFIATSDNGVKWKEEGGVAWKGVTVGRAIPLDGGVRFYYLERMPSGPALYRLMSDTSKDGLTFKKDDGVRLTPRKGFALGGPSVLRLRDGTYRMFFDETESTASNGQGAIIWGASSKDGLTWTRDEKLTIEAQKHEEGLTGGPQVLHPCAFEWAGGGYVMFYESHGTIFAARSDDGTVWFKIGSMGVRGTDPDVVPLSGVSFRIYFGRFSPETGAEIYTAALRGE